jgi:predicted Zn-dependent protease
VRQAILVLTVIVSAVVIGTSAVAYAEQSDDKKTSPETTDSPENTTSSESKQPITIENHAWKNYHWARSANPFTLELGDNVTEAWDSYLDTTVSDWNESDVLDTTKVAGGTNRKKCRPTKGRVEVCNAKYGRKGWLGITRIWVAGSHIDRATTKLNDTYFNQARYNTPEWRTQVMCHEVGHTLGLDHQDENFRNPNLGSCMDYTRRPGSNQHPNQHDYDQLRTIYEKHTDGSTTTGQTTTGDKNEPGDDPREWGREESRSSDGRESIYEKDLGKGKKKVTHVLWTLEEAAKHRRGHNEDHEHQE